LEEQGAYRNLLDEATLRDGRLPATERILAKACGDAHAWKRLRVAVLAKFVRKGRAWRNPTLDAVWHESQRRIDKQRAYRIRLGNAIGNTAGNGRGNKRGSSNLDIKNPPTPLKGGRPTRQEIKHATEVPNRVHGRCQH